MISDASLHHIEQLTANCCQSTNNNLSDRRRPSPVKLLITHYS